MNNNYIRRLEDTRDAQSVQISAMLDSIARFRAHLASDKFLTDPTIQVADVNRWLSVIVGDGYAAHDAYTRKEGN